MSIDMNHYGDNFIPVVPSEYLEHSPDHPFCWDTQCPCHEDQAAIGEVHQAYLDGLVTKDEATKIVQGQTL